MADARIESPRHRIIPDRPVRWGRLERVRSSGLGIFSIDSFPPALDSLAKRQAPARSLEEDAMTHDGTGMSLASYRDLVEALLKKGYAITDYEGFDPNQRHLMLRHDVDLCLSRAVEMAEAEQAMGVSSYYFILLNTEMYNAGSAMGRRAIRRFAELGHQVGLHFDHSEIQEGDLAGLDEAIRRECSVLENVASNAVRAVTFHRPSKWLQGLGAIGGRPHGYQTRFFSPDRYCSDSEGRFRFHHPLAHPAVLSGRGLHLVTHPIWWCAEVTEGPLEKLERFYEQLSVRLASEIAANCRPFRQRMRKPLPARPSVS